MSRLINIWIIFGYTVYWIFWIGSVLLGCSVGFGIIVGCAAFAIWLLILIIISLIEYKEWWFKGS